MAYTKIFTIKDDVQRSIDYITQEIKTNKELIYFNKCNIMDTTSEFEFIRKKFNSRVKIKARHIVQAYAYNEDVDYEKALKIAKEFCEKHLKNHQYVIAVHTDQKHVHAHIVFNTVNMKTGKAYRSNKKTFHKYFLKDYNEILQNNNLDKAKVKNKKYKHKFNGRKSLRDLLKNDIDIAIKNSKTYDDFIKNMSIDYYVKETPKNLSFKHKVFGEKFLRCNKNLGENYLKDKIKDRINKGNEYIDKPIKNNINKNKNKSKYKTNNTNKDIDYRTKYKEIDKEIGFIIDVNKNEKALKYKGYRNWAIKNNIKTINNIYNILDKKYNIKYNIYKAIINRINENINKLNNSFNSDEIYNLKNENYELKRILENLEKANIDMNIER